MECLTDESGKEKLSFYYVEMARNKMAAPINVLALILQLILASKGA